MIRRRSGSTLRTIVLTTLVVGGLLVAAVSIGWTILRNPFRTETVDRSTPPLLTSLQNISEFHAARGNFQVLVDLEHDVKYIPSALAGERLVFMGVGSVDSYVDFSKLDATAIQTDEKAHSVVITLPAPDLSTPALDATQSHVVADDKGLLNRLGDLFSSGSDSEQALYVAATAKIADAAEAAQLQKQGEDNTRVMLQGLLTGLGYEHIEINFESGVTPAA